MTLPNYISILRIFLVPVFVGAIIYHVGEGDEAYRWAAVSIFAIASVSDMVDGLLARRLGMASRLGAVLDPLADKLLLVSGVVMLSLETGSSLATIPVWLTVLIISRDAFLGMGAMLIVYLGKPPQVRPRILGKAAAVSQMALILWILLKLPDAGLAFLIGITGILTLLSGIQYIVDGVRQLSAQEARQETGRGAESSSTPEERPS